MSGPIGIIAGNGRFPFLVAAAARRAGRRVVIVAIREEAEREIEGQGDEVHWVGLGQLGRCIEALRGAGVSEAVMAGQVKHRQIFSDVVPDLKLMGVIAKLAFKNTDSLIGGVANALESEGIRLLPSISLLGDQMASPGAMSRRAPTRDEQKDVEYGIEVCRTLTGLDLGQTVVVKERAAVALEAMEGTDAVIRRAGQIAGAGCVVVKLAKPKQDMRFDVPVVGLATIDGMAAARAGVLAVEAGRTLLIDRPEVLRAADAAGIAVVGVSG